jgi:hypothetical protein
MPFSDGYQSSTHETRLYIITHANNQPSQKASTNWGEVRCAGCIRPRDLEGTRSNKICGNHNNELWTFHLTIVLVFHCKRAARPVRQSCVGEATRGGAYLALRHWQSFIRRLKFAFKGWMYVIGWFLSRDVNITCRKLFGNSFHRHMHPHVYW